MAKLTCTAIDKSVNRRARGIGVLASRLLLGKMTRRGLSRDGEKMKTEWLLSRIQSRIKVNVIILTGNKNRRERFRGPTSAIGWTQRFGPSEFGSVLLVLRYQVSCLQRRTWAVGLITPWSSRMLVSSSTSWEFSSEDLNGTRWRKLNVFIGWCPCNDNFPPQASLDSRRASFGKYEWSQSHSHTIATQHCNRYRYLDLWD